MLKELDCPKQTRVRRSAVGGFFSHQRRSRLTNLANVVDRIDSVCRATGVAEVPPIPFPFSAAWVFWPSSLEGDGGGGGGDADAPPAENMACRR